MDGSNIGPNVRQCDSLGHGTGILGTLPCRGKERPKALNDIPASTCQLDGLDGRIVTIPYK